MRRNARSTVLTTLIVSGALALTACGGGSGFDDEPNGSAASGSASGKSGAPLTVLIGSSGDAETDAVTAAVAAWSKKSGIKARAQAASDLNQELAQGFAAGNPADIFYTSTDLIAGYVAAGNLYPYGDQLSNVDDVYPALIDTFTIDDKLYCAPTNFSTLALVINTDSWKAAGLTDADIPTDWDGLAAAAKALTTDKQVGLSFGPEYQRIGAFMAEAGGAIIDEDGTTAVVDSPENLKALTFVKKMLANDTLKYPSEIGAGWGGEAFGSGGAAMTVEGNWINGALQKDFPDVKYKVVEMPKGAAGKGTMLYTNCWGIAQDSKNKQGAVSLVKYLTSKDVQVDLLEAYGVMPSVQSARDDFFRVYPEQGAFLAGGDYGVGLPTIQGANDVIADFNGQLEGLATAKPQSILSSVQTNMQALLDSKR